MRYTFDRTPTGAIYLANIRLSKRSAEEGAGQLAVVADGATVEGAIPAAAPATGAARIVAIRPAATAGTASGTQAASGGGLDVEIAADRALPVTDALPTLLIGDQSFQQSRFANAGKTDRLIFTIKRETFAQLADVARTELRIGGRERLALGRLDKSMLH